jgi:bifunctional DNA-binding transcriptional regulator/antitoxin component of YhaV-PrlF toxin-antitoxin module
MHVELDDVEFVTETSVTIRGSRRRTTVPKEITDRLGLVNADKLRWALLRDGTVFITHVCRIHPHEADSHSDGRSDA